jgi:hypothetical protein
MSSRKERNVIVRLVRLDVLFLLFACAGFLYGQDQTQRVSPVNAPDTTVRRFEIGGQFTGLTLGSPGEINVPKFALGPGFAFNLNRHLALDAYYSVMNLPSCPFTSCSGGRASEFVAGVRAEAREKHYGMYAYGRPGVFHTTALTVTESLPGFTTTTITWPSTSRFVTNVGGGIEFFAPSRVHTRVELGDLLFYYPCSNCNPPSTWTNQLQFSVGMYAAVG